MKPRIEQKLLVGPGEYPALLAWLSRSGATVLHPDRVVTSTYFDTPDLLMFRDTAEGISPRKKVRIRCYGSHDAECSAKHSLEIKLTTEAGRLKRSSGCPDWRQVFAAGVFDPDYGLCEPAVTVNYQRSYYSVHDVRVTVDRHLRYRGVRSDAIAAQWFDDAGMAVEVKAPAGEDLDRLANDFPIPRTHFSKYERAIHAVRPRA